MVVRVLRAVAVKLSYRTATSPWLDVPACRTEGDYEVYRLMLEDGPIELHVCSYDWRRAYAIAGIPAQVSWDNRKTQPRQVIDAMVRDLQDLAQAGNRLCLWEEAYHCCPGVAEHLKRIFSHSVLMAANDNDGCGVVGWTQVATGPSARFFDSVIHGNIIWKNDGSRTADMYRSLGVSDLYYATQPLSPSFGDSLTDRGFDFDDRMAKVRHKEYSLDLAFVGGQHGRLRYILNEPTTSALFMSSGIRSKIYGYGMRDGDLLPKDAVDDWGRPVAGLYLNAFSTVNIPFIGLLSMRMYDAWESGTLLIQRDPVGELDEFGIKDGVHYVGYDGTMHGLICMIRCQQDCADETESILRAGRLKGRHMRETYSKIHAMERLLSRHSHKWDWSRQ